MSFQTKTEDLLNFGLNCSPNMLQMLSQPQQNMNGFYMPQNSSQPLISGFGQDVSSLFQQSSKPNPTNVDIAATLQLLLQQTQLQQLQQQQPQQNQNLSFLILQQLLQQQQSQQLQQQVLAQQQQQQLLLNSQLHLNQNQRTNLLMNHGLNNQINNNLLNALCMQTLQSQTSQATTNIKEEVQDSSYDADDNSMEDEQATAQQSPKKTASSLDEAQARARAQTASIFNPISDFKMGMLQTPIANHKRDSFYTPLNQQLATQQIFQNNSINSSNTKLPEFQLNQVQPSIQLQNFMSMMKINNTTAPTNKVNFSSMNINPDLLTKEQINDLKRQMGITVRDRETLAPFLEQWNSRNETEQLIAGSYAILKQFPYEKTQGFENEFQVEYTEQSQKCNYVNKFINSKGLIVKDEKLGKIKIENKISRFHNLSRLLMYTILTAFNKNNISQMNLDAQKLEAITKTIQRLKQSARKKTPKGLIKTDFFNHTHYNVLFLTINEQNIEQVRKNSKDVGTHMKVFNVDLEKPYHEIVEELRYSNIIKKLAYHIMLASYKKSKDDKNDDDQNNSSNSTFREQYIDRAMVGIGKLNQGVLIQRF